MPGAVSRTSTIALTSTTLNYGLQLANKGWEKAIADNAALKLGLNTHDGKLVYKAVADALNLPCQEI